MTKQRGNVMRVRVQSRDVPKAIVDAVHNAINCCRDSMDVEGDYTLQDQVAWVQYGDSWEAHVSLSFKENQLFLAKGQLHFNLKMTDDLGKAEKAIASTIGSVSWLHSHAAREIAIEELAELSQRMKERSNHHKKA